MQCFVSPPLSLVCINQGAPYSIQKKWYAHFRFFRSWWQTRVCVCVCFFLFARIINKHWKELNYWRMSWWTSLRTSRKLVKRKRVKVSGSPQWGQHEHIAHRRAGNSQQPEKHVARKKLRKRLEAGKRGISHITNRSINEAPVESRVQILEAEMAWKRAHRVVLLLPAETANREQLYMIKYTYTIIVHITTK